MHQKNASKKKGRNWDKGKDGDVCRCECVVSECYVCVRREGEKKERKKERGRERGNENKKRKRKTGNSTQGGKSGVESFMFCATLYPFSLIIVIARL